MPPRYVNARRRTGAVTLRGISGPISPRRGLVRATASRQRAEETRLGARDERAERLRAGGQGLGEGVAWRTPQRFTDYRHCTTVTNQHRATTNARGLLAHTTDREMLRLQRANGGRHTAPVSRFETYRSIQADVQRPALRALCFLTIQLEHLLIHCLPERCLQIISYLSTSYRFPPVWLTSG
jgi:hypothetical protein